MWILALPEVLKRYHCVRHGNVADSERRCVMVLEYIDQNLARTLREGRVRTVFDGRERSEVRKERIEGRILRVRIAGYVACAAGSRDDLLIKLFHLPIQVVIGRMMLP